MATYEAAFKDHRHRLAPGEWATTMLLAADRAQARTLLCYIRGLFENPMLTRMVVRETTSGLELTNRSAIEVHTASHRAVRGYTLAAVIADEIAFWHDDGARPDAEVIAALRPALATLGGKLVAISSHMPNEESCGTHTDGITAKNIPGLSSPKRQATR